MGKALYRRYRSKSLSEIVGQEHITQTLAEAIKQGRISHAYLFTGPRGVGKTSIARILAHEINSLPYDDEAAHMDIIEIDAASNRRIDEIRDLRDKVNISPTSAQYKVYIIDEVHMLTREAFNALLKTLEEPPAHAVFILATTDAHKLPDTIVSRTQRYTFKPVAKQKVVEHLAAIANQEKIKVSPEALELLAEHGEGSFRDSISLLDQASSHGKKIEAEDIRTLLGIPSASAVQNLYNLLSEKVPPGEIMQAVTGLFEQGYQAAAIAKQLAGLLRESLLSNSSVLGSNDTLQLLHDLLQVPAAADSERYLEIILLGYADATAAAKSPAVATAPKSAPSKIETIKPAPVDPEPIITEDTPEPDLTLEVEAKGSGVLDAAVWPQVLEALKQKYNTLYGVVRMAEPKFSKGGLELHFGFAFHQKRISEPANRKILGDIIEQVTGQKVTIECHYTKGTKPKPGLPVAPKPTADLSAISNIFGGGEII